MKHNYEQFDNIAIANLALGFKYNSPLSRIFGDVKQGQYSAEEIMKMFEDNRSKEMYEACFEEAIDRHFGNRNTEDLEDDVLAERFYFDNIFPEEERKLDLSENWIKVYNQEKTGFSLYYARQFRYTRKTARKKVFTLTPKVAKELSKLTRMLKDGFAEALSSKDLTARMEKNQKQRLKTEEMQKELLMFELIESTGISPIFARYNTTKTQKKVVLEKDYDILDDDIIDRLKDINGDTVKKKTIYNPDTKNQVNYLMTRGINRDTAEAMANLHGMSLHYNITKMFKQLEDENLQNINKI